VARRGNEPQAKAFDVVIGVVERVNFVRLVEAAARVEIEATAVVPR
jgi:hypothetical protein